MFVTLHELPLKWDSINILRLYTLVPPVIAKWAWARTYLVHNSRYLHLEQEYAITCYYTSHYIRCTMAILMSSLNELISMLINTMVMRSAYLIDAAEKLEGSLMFVIFGIHTSGQAQTFGFKSLPCCMRVPMVNQKLFDKENWFSTTSDPAWHGCGLFHSYGLNRATTNIVTDTKI